MTSVKDAFIQLLKDNRQSVTRVRRVVFEALLGQEPLTIHQLVERAQGIDRASVYRTVDLFEQLGIVQRLNTGWKYKLELSDKFAEHHHHLTCLHCGRTISMNEDELEELIAKLATSHGFAPHSHQIEIQGICENCKESNQPLVRS